MTEKKRLMLIDGHAMAYRAYHALPAMTGPTGEPTNAVLGFANMLLKAIEDHAPDYVIATFDVGPTFRHNEFPEYKAHRAETPPDLRAQFDRITQLVEAFSIPIFVAEGYEADDVLGTLSRQAAAQGLETIIVTGDSDTFQLIDENTLVLTPRRSFGETTLFGIDEVRERYGLEPHQLIDFKAIAGDSSDNIPGVRGVGAKTATTLLQQYGDLDSIYEHLEEVSSARFRNALANGRDAAYLSQRLITIVRDVDIALDVNAGVWGTYDRDRVMALLRELGFRGLASRLPRREGPAQQLDLFGNALPQDDDGAEASDGEGLDYGIVDTTEALDAMISALSACKRFAIDTETTGTDAMRARLVGLSMSCGPKQAWYVPVGHDRRLAVGDQLALATVRERLAPILADKAIGKVCHNAKYDVKVLARHDMPLYGLEYDTMIAAWILEPSGRGIGLKTQAWQRLGVEMTDIEVLIGKGSKQIGMDQVRIAKAAPYACADADMTLRLVDELMPELERQQQTRLYREIEMPLIQVLVGMEMVGITLDTAYMGDLAAEIDGRLAELEGEIHDMAGHSFNINSTQQLGAVLFDEMDLPVQRRTRTGYSTDAGVMEALRPAHPIAELIIEHRQLTKLKGTYVDALPLLVHPETGRIHTSFRQTSTTTGRLSSSDPNLQNIPVRTEMGRRVRGAFVAAGGHVLLGCDYSQVELRMLAHISRDPEMLGAFARDEDVHASTAAAIHGVPLDEVTSEQRRLAKAINFGLMYGMGEYGLARRTELELPDARRFIEAYFGRFSRVREYLDETVRFAHEHGYVETLLGRRRYFPELRADSAANQRVKSAAERAAVNMPIQGTAADILKLAMIALDRRLRESGLRARMVLQIHDELVLEVPEDELDEVTALVVETMENAYSLDVRLKVDVAVSKNWMEMK